MTDKLPSGEAIRAGEAVDLDAIKARWGFEYGAISKDVRALIAEVERLRAASDAPERDTRPVCESCIKLDAELRHMMRKLEEGTLHVLYCNGDHNARLGVEGKICNCTLGQEIKALRRRAEKAEAELASPRASAATEPPDKVKTAVFRYISALVITSDNIGDVRRSLLMPFDCKYNGWVRDTTAALENKPSETVLSSPSPAPTGEK